MLTELKSVVESAKREASLTQQALDRIQTAATKLAAAQQETEAYLEGVSEILAEAHTPTLGIHHTWTAANGDAVIHEDRIRSAAETHAHDAVSLQQAIDALLGGPWDRELEPFRYAGDGAAVRWLHKVG